MVRRLWGLSRSSLLQLTHSLCTALHASCVGTGCPAGYECPGSQRTAVGSRCTAGKYSPPRASTCLPCSAGRFSGTPGAYLCDECGGREWYCPDSMMQAPLAVGPGNYSSGGNLATLQTSQAVCGAGFYCVGGERFPCPAGRFGDSPGLTSPQCTSECEAGRYCAVGATGPVPCGSQDRFCVAGSGTPASVAVGFYTTPTTAPAHLRHNQSQCEPGYFCRLGARQECGAATQFCPRGSSDPVLAMPGQYTVPESAPAARREDVAPCPMGWFCVGGVRAACRAGRYGDAPSVSTDACSGECAAGYYCPAASTNATARACGSADVFCPAASGTPTDVLEGWYTVDASGAAGNNPGHLVNALQCEQGHWCSVGVRSVCGAGTFGASVGLSVPTCSGLCSAGHYCVAGSTVSTPQHCGAGNYCPAGSGTPTPVTLGWYAFGGPDPVEHTNQTVCPTGSYCVSSTLYACPAGRYGDARGLSNSSCSGACTGGYYCPAGSTRATALPCGSADKWCPPGAAAPTAITDQHHYTTPQSASPLLRTGERTCDAGYYCVGGYRLQCGAASSFCPPGSDSATTVQTGYYSAPVTTSAALRTTEEPCLEGSYCQDGVRHSCPPGRYGQVQRLSSSACSGDCPAGSYCPLGSPSPSPCGGASVYCPSASSAPRLVTVGHYSHTGVDATVMQAEAICPAGMSFSGGSTSYPEQVAHTPCLCTCVVFRLVLRRRRAAGMRSWALRSDDGAQLGRLHRSLRRWLRVPCW